MRLRTKIAWWAVVGIGTILGIGLIVLFSIPFSAAKPFMDSLARDGRADQFSAAFVAQWGAWLRVAGLLWLGGAALFAGLRRRSLDWTARALDAIERGARRLAGDGRLLLHGFSFDWKWGLGVMLIMLWAILTTARYMNRPMGHDEAYTFMAFARQPLLQALSDYSLPNNHLFHTFWLYLAYHLLGSAPWVVRLPAFTAGILLIPAIYALGSRLYSRPVGLLAAALVAASGEVWLYETNARGYTLLTLIALLFFWLSWIVKRQRNLSAWGLWVVAAALGFYTVPVFLYPFGAICAWLFFSMLAGDTQGYANRTDFLRCLLISGLLAGGLTFLLYTPVFLHHHSFKVLFANQFVESMAWKEFLVTAPIRINETWGEWVNGYEPWVRYTLIGGFGLSILLHWKMTRIRIPPQVAAAAWFIPLVLIQKVQLWTKTWFFLHPLALLWCAAGLVGLAQWFFQRLPLRRWALAGLLAAALGVSLYGGWQVRQDGDKHATSPGMEEEFVIYIKGHLQDEDILVSNWISEPAISYYLLRYQIPVKMLFVKSLPFKQAYVIVNQEINLNVQDVLKDRGLDPTLFDLERAAEVHHRGNSSMYRVPVKENVLAAPAP